MLQIADAISKIVKIQYYKCIQKFYKFIAKLYNRNLC